MRRARLTMPPRASPELLILVLQLIKLPVDPAHREQLLMRARFPQLALVHHENPVRALNRGKPVRDDDRRATFHQVVERIAHTNLGLRIHAGSGFIQDQESADRAPAPAQS